MEALRRRDVLNGPDQVVPGREGSTALRRILRAPRSATASQALGRPGSGRRVNGTVGSETDGSLSTIMAINRSIGLVAGTNRRRRRLEGLDDR